MTTYSLSHSPPLAVLRQRLKQQRAQLTPQRQRALATRMVRHLWQDHRYRAAKHIALYLPVRGEANPTNLYQCGSLPHQCFYLPVLHPLAYTSSTTDYRSLKFVRWKSNTVFRRNRFGIPEPLYRPQDCISPHALDIVITPLLGFDDQGHRLGMGGGFYDRTFAFTRYTSNAPYLIGYAYAFQHCDALVKQHWDVPLNACVTEHKLYHY
ncbi:MAG: 5-formyltetrahydrofolate cyclo-ligase [bacterium]